MKKEADKIKYRQGQPTPLGVTRHGEEWNFAVSVSHTKECKLLLSLPCDENESSDTELTITMEESYRSGSVFAVMVSGLKEGFTYRYQSGEECFLDPYGTRVIGREVFGAGEQELKKASAVAEQDYDWQQDIAPSHPFCDLILYKLHVRGFTMDKSSKVKHPGTFLGVTEKLEHIKELGVNAVLLMPCVEFEERMEDKVNYWGYGAKSFYFSPKASYASDPARAASEFKDMVRMLHKNGIEVLMELSFPQGIAPSVILDALRFWVRVYHLDGFRLAPLSVPSVLIANDPYLSCTKLISDEWDENAVFEQPGRKDHYERESLYGGKKGKNASSGVTDERHLAVWNTHFMNTVRRFMKGDEAQTAAFTDVMRKNPARIASINYITDNNGFTLADLYSYDLKHNEANGEDNRDGNEYNYSWNCGKEGKSDSKKLTKLRRRMMRNALTALFLAQGTPMLFAGDELLNSQDGNNNAYCQDNETGWIQWSNSATIREQLQFVRKLIQMRKEHSVFHNPLELRMMDYISCGCPDLSLHGVKAWYPDFSYYSRTVGILYNGRYAHKSRGCPEDDFYLVWNMHWEEHDFDLPITGRSGEWEVVLTATEKHIIPNLNARSIHVPERTVVVLMLIDKAVVKNDEMTKAPV